MKIPAYFTASCCTLIALSLPAGAADPIRFLPPETEKVVWLDLRQALDSGVGKKDILEAVKGLLAETDAQKILKTLGLDPLKDVDTVVGGLWGLDPMDQDGLFVAAGRFDVKKLTAGAEEAARQFEKTVSTEKVGSHTVVKITAENRESPSWWITVADEHTVLMGAKKSTLVAALEVAGDAKPVLKEDLGRLVEARDRKACLFFCWTSNGEVDDVPPIPLLENTEKLKKQLQKLRTGTLAMRVSDGVDVELTLGMADEAAAGDFQKTVGGLLDQAKGFLPLLAFSEPAAEPLVADLTKSLRNEAEGKNLVVSFRAMADAVAKPFASE
jgi:hypothetical protein